MDTVLERIFQAKLIKDLKSYFPGCIVLKNDPNYIQGMPDLTVLYNNHWALLEVKNSSKASRQPNQEFYISKAKEMSYGAFIFPENKETILNEMAESFKPKGTARVPVRK